MDPDALEVREIHTCSTGLMVTLFIIALIVILPGMVCADRNDPATPEIQGLSTTTGMNVLGTVSESDSIAWSLSSGGIPASGNDPVLANYPGWSSSVWGSYSDFLDFWNDYWAIPELYDEFGLPLPHLNDMLNALINSDDPEAQESAHALQNWLVSQGGLHDPPLWDNEVRYTTVYSDNLMAVSGQTRLVKTMAVSTGNKIADQTNIKAETSLQYVAVDTGRATREEDMLIDGVAMWTNTSSAILCPFASEASPVIPAYCNIVAAGSTMDTTLTSVVTSASDRFVGTDSTSPVALKYSIDAQGLSRGSQSSPMIGSVSAFLKVHIQEARNQSTIPDTTWEDPDYAVITLTPDKTEDIVYSETSSASGLVDRFSKSVSYQTGFNLI
jgi:hypothetical protein